MRFKDFRSAAPSNGTAVEEAVEVQRDRMQ